MLRTKSGRQETNMKRLAIMRNFAAKLLRMQINKNKLKAKIKFKVVSFIAMLPYHILVMGSVAIFSFIFDKWIEAILFLISFFSLRYKFPTTFHAKSLVYCMVLTNLMFALSVTFCPYAETYIFGALVFAFADTFILCYIQDKEELRQDKKCAEALAVQLQQKLSKHENPEIVFMDKCRKAKLSKRDTEIAVKYFIEHQKPKEIWIWLCKTKEYNSINWDSMHQLLWRIGNKIFCRGFVENKSSFLMLKSELK